MDAFEEAVGPFEMVDRLLAEGDLMTGQPIAVVRVEPGGAVGAEHEVLAPAGQFEGQLEAGMASAMDGDRSVAPLPAVAVRAVVDAPAVERLNPGDSGDLVDDPGGHQQDAGREPGAVLELDLEALLKTPGRDDLGLPQFDGWVSPELLAPDSQQLGGFDAVAGEEAVQAVRGGVARAAVVEDDHPAAAPPEEERGVQAGRAGAHDDDVDHDRAPRLEK